MKEFRRRGAPIPNPPDGYAIRRFCIELPDAPEYRQAFFGQLWELGNAWFWKKDRPYDENDQIAAQIWREYMSRNVDRFESETDCDLTDLCLSYPNTASFIQYYPNDPRYPAEGVPEGYTQDPWYFATTASGILFGTQTGDIVTSLDKFPPGSLPTIIPASGLPRIRINVNGAGRITVNLRTMFAGSKIQITRDDDVLTAYFVDVLRDIASIPPTTVTEIAVDIDFDTPGEHHADLIVVSAINDELPYLFHGAGLVSVELCGLMPYFEETPMYGAIRIAADCGLEQYNTSTLEWEHVADVLQLPAGPDCALTGRLYQNIASPTGSGGIRLNRQGAPNTTHGTGIFAGWAETSDGAAKTLFSIDAALKNATAAAESSRFRIAMMDAGAQRELLVINEATHGFLMTLPDASPHGLYLRPNGVRGVGSNIMRIDRAPNVEAWRISDSGTIVHTAANASASSYIGLNNLIATNPTPAAGFGGGFDIYGSTIGGSAQRIGRFIANWLDANSASRRGEIRLIADWSGGQAVVVRAGAGTAGQSLLGFHNTAPIAKPNATGTTVPVALASLIAAATATGLISHNTDFLANAANLIRLTACALQQFNPVTAAWEDVANIVPAVMDEDCDTIHAIETGVNIIRVGGSTEAANPVLTLQANLGEALDTLPMMLDFKQQQGDLGVETLAQMDVRQMADDTPRLAINLWDGTGIDTLMEVRNGPAGRRIGFMGNVPVAKQVIFADETSDDIIQRIALGLEQLGLFRIAPCFAAFGDWGVKFTGDSLTDLATCGVVSGPYITNELDCPFPDDNIAGMQTSWGASPELNIVHVYAKFTITSVVPAEGVNWTIIKNPGTSAVILDTANINALGTFERAWNGSTAVEDIGFSISDVDVDAAFQIEEIRIEGTGAIPPDWLNGDECE